MHRQIERRADKSTSFSSYNQTPAIGQANKELGTGSRLLLLSHFGARSRTPWLLGSSRIHFLLPTPCQSSQDFITRLMQRPPRNLGTWEPGSLLCLGTPLCLVLAAPAHFNGNLSAGQGCRAGSHGLAPVYKRQCKLHSNGHNLDVHGVAPHAGELLVGEFARKDHTVNGKPMNHDLFKRANDPSGS